MNKSCQFKMSDKIDSSTNDNFINGENEFVKNEQIIKILEENGIHSYDSQVVTHLNEYINNYTTEVLTNATNFAIHAGRKSVNTSDVKLSLEMASKKPAKRLSRKELLELAKHHNQTQLPQCNSLNSIPLPSEGSVLINCNYKLKSATFPYQVNIPFMNERQNPILTFNPMKSHAGGRPTIGRSVNMPLNLTSPRLVLKSINNIDKNHKKRKQDQRRK